MGKWCVLLLGLALVDWTCAFQPPPRRAGVYQDTPVNVHVICHSHDDTGWQKSVDEYYAGLNNSIQNAGVQYVLDNVYRFLMADPEKKFTWWREATPAVQEDMRRLTKEGRLEFVGGGWCQNDEAAPAVQGIIDQMTTGHQFLLREIGPAARPRIGWQLDPFGHSSAHTYLFSQMGFDAVFFARIDYQDYGLRVANKELEFVWRGERSTGESSDLFTDVMYEHYDYPQGFNFEAGADDAIQDDPLMHDYNVYDRVDEFAAAMAERQSHLRHNEVMIYMGDDFQYQAADKNFKNIDKIIKFVKCISLPFMQWIK